MTATQPDLSGRDGGRKLAAANAAVDAYAAQHDYRRVHGALGWMTPAERFDGTPLGDQDFRHVPVLVKVAGLLADPMVAA